MLQYLLAAAVSWAVCGILTAAGVFSDDPSDPSYRARTDARAAVIQTADWVTLSYPGSQVLLMFCISELKVVLRYIRRLQRSLITRVNADGHYTSINIYTCLWHSLVL